MKKYFNRVKTYLHVYFPILIIVCLTSLIGTINYKPGTLLTGWDNLHPEFNFGLNIQRSIFGVWQEFQGLGLLGGMGHAADLPRQIILLALSLVIPTQNLRYVWTIMLLGIGSVGSYYLIYYLLSKIHNPDHPIPLLLKKLTALTGAIFYLCNLATVQTFYVVFEAFSTHYAFLPWLLLSAFLYFERQDKKSLLFFSIILLLAIPQNYIPTLFVVWIIALSIFLFIITLVKPKKHLFIRTAKTYGVIFFINAFWLLPFLYFTLNHADTVLNAKINQMSTTTVFLQNKEFGDIFDVMLLKGFWFKNVDPNNLGNFSYMMGAWKSYIENPLPITIGVICFLFALYGCFVVIKTKRPVGFGLALLFLFSFTVLAVDSPPFAWIDSLFREHIPLFSEAFRFPYTKFSILAGLSYATLFAIGIFDLIQMVEKNTFRYVSILLSINLITLLLVFPLFQGHLFYEKEQLSLPHDYQRMFSFFNTQDPSTRIMDFNQYNYWGWSFYRWGYGGSGFPWYGIPQSMVDRNFDMWSPYNENLYWEISNAIYANKPSQIEQIFNKYQVTWLLVDKNIFTPDNPANTYPLTIGKLFNKIKGVERVKQFGNIAIYHYDLLHPSKKFVALASNLPTANQYTWGDYDQMYIKYHDYQSQNSSAKDQLVYPFRQLFSGKFQNELAFTAQEKTDTVLLSATISAPLSDKVLIVPSLANTAKSISITIQTEKEKNNVLDIDFVYNLPQVLINNAPLIHEQNKQIIFRLPGSIPYPFHLSIGTDQFTIPNQASVIGTTSLLTNQDNVILLANTAANFSRVQILSKSNLEAIPLFKNQQEIPLASLHTGDIISVVIPKILNDENSFIVNPQTQQGSVANCDNFRRYQSSSSIDNNNILHLYAKDAATCLSLYSGLLSHENGYIIFVKSKNVEGRGLHFWLENATQHTASIDTYLPNTTKETISTFAVAPQENFGQGYALHFDNISIGRDITKNDLGQVSMYQIPYEFINNLLITTNSPLSPVVFDTGLITVSHPNESIYTITTPTHMKPYATLILAQSYESGWHMYEVPSFNILTTSLPFIFGKHISNHLIVNNWSNGWQIDSGSNTGHFIIIYLPQYLEYLGFLSLTLPFMWLFLLIAKSRLIAHTK